MSSEKQPKRIVSKLAYAGHVGKKGATWTAGGALFGIGLGGLALDGFVLLAVWVMNWGDVSTLLSASMILLFIGCLCGLSIWAGTDMMDTASKPTEVIPFTRQTAAQLPPDESLVRASDQPTTPTDTLLRTTNASTETPKEELLRSTISDA